MSATYKDAGVDLDVYRESMSRLPRLMHRTFSPRVRRLDGGFAGLFQLDFNNPLFDRNYQDPVLVSCTDGVGTKLKVASLTGKHHTVGIDLVAMCANDALCCGAEPLFFNDYVAMSKDDPQLLEQIVEGISNGCLAADCALNSGETAIMPDLYAPGEYDLAGFCVGVVERKQLIDGSRISAGDVILGVAATGLHSNGFSLVRRVVFDQCGLHADEQISALQRTVGETLMTPTRIYVRPVRRMLRCYGQESVVHGIAHITGGGVQENIARLLPHDTRAEIRRGSWQIPEVFSWLQALGQIADEEMYGVFNMGIGLALIVNEHYAERIQHTLAAEGLASWDVGRITSGQGEAVWVQ